MRIFVIIFIIVSVIAAFATIAYVVADIILSKRKEEEPEPIVEPEPIPEPEPEPEPIIVLPEIVEHIDAVEADEMISDEVAMAVSTTELGAGEGLRLFVNLGDISEAFEAGATVTLADLKEKKLIDSKAKRLKILADGILDKPLTIKAESFSIQAVKMIELTGGTVVFLK